MQTVPLFKGIAHATGKEGPWVKGELIAIIIEGEAGAVGYDDHALIITIFSYIGKKGKQVKIYEHALRCLDTARYDFLHRNHCLHYGKPAPDVVVR